ncbi:xylulokinase [Streptomyces gilvus]|uniref:xylulokinase n=1 Tax=Streptomyces gilvus TaxID=2920937 RepID=UPI001F0CFA2E|nr:FGGY family carbohydrate kinase [Streptomyces sp. CME 23]MCH5677962.1 hypothetical protein [Streptomyces sp. CME 23]
MSEQYLLGIDTGGSGVRAVLFEAHGKCVASASRAFSPHFEADGTAFYSVAEVQNAEIEAIRDTVSESGVDPRQIVGISAAVLGVLLTGFSADGEALTECLFFSDPRFTSHTDDVWTALRATGMSEEEYHAITHSHPRTLSAILAIREQQPELATRVARWSNTMQPFLYSALGGRWDIDPEDYGGYKNAYNPVARRFDPSVAAALDLPETHWVEHRYLAEPCGAVSREGAALTGLTEGTPLFAGANDQLAQMIAQGALGEDDLCLNLGSSAVLSRLTSGSPGAFDPLVQVVGGGSPDRLRLTSNMATFGSSLTWLKDQIAFGFLGADAEERLNEDPFRFMTQMARTSPVGAHGVSFAPLFIGRPDAPYARASFFGIDLATTTADLVRAVVESTAFEIRTCMEALERATQRSAQVAYATGGPSESTLWMQIVADVTGLTLKCSSTPRLTGAKGAAIIAGIGAGIYADPADGLARQGEDTVTVVPDPETSARYEPLYRAYTRMVDAACQHIYQPPEAAVARAVAA